MYTMYMYMYIAYIIYMYIIIHVHVYNVHVFAHTTTISIFAIKIKSIKYKASMPSERLDLSVYLLLSVITSYYQFFLLGEPKTN